MYTRKCMHTFPTLYLTPGHVYYIYIQKKEKYTMYILNAGCMQPTLVRSYLQCTVNVIISVYTPRTQTV